MAAKSRLSEVDLGPVSIRKDLGLQLYGYANFNLTDKEGNFRTFQIVFYLQKTKDNKSGATNMVWWFYNTFSKSFFSADRCINEHKDECEDNITVLESLNLTCGPITACPHYRKFYYWGNNSFYFSFVNNKN
jgi:hypothetical protein